MILSENPRLQREAATIRVMIALYCHDQHHSYQALCADCQALSAYAMARLEKCPFEAEKPTCANCKIHCYKAEMRERIQTVMRYAGPRMLLRHPILTIWHLIDGRRPTPEKPVRKK